MSALLVIPHYLLAIRRHCPPLASHSICSALCLSHPLLDRRGHVAWKGYAGYLLLARVQTIASPSHFAMGLRVAIPPNCLVSSLSALQALNFLLHRT